MTLTERCAADLLAAATAYAGARQITFATLGRYVANDSRFFTKIQEGSRSFSVARYEAAMAWFSWNWPDGVPWPRDVRRPRRPPERGVDGAKSARA
jgi:hypothetical protein